MGVQITVRLSDEIAAYIDGLVERGTVKSRAAAVEQAMRRQRRRDRAEQDALIYAQHGEDPEVSAFADAAFAARFGDGVEVPAEDRGAFDRAYPPTT
jgi:Arc/MetJ-type ribon-helix-helix transcriptional regulator